MSKSEMMSWLLLINDVEPKKEIKAIDRFRKKKKKSRFWNSQVSRIWSQIKNRKVVYERKNPWRIFC